MISDHFHPWIAHRVRARSCGACSVGSRKTEQIPITTGVTCPMMRPHPAIVAQAAATRPPCCTTGLRSVGTGENLNEHVPAARWPAPDERVEMLGEAIDVIRRLWQGGEQTHRGIHYTVDHATLYTLPGQPIPIAVAAARPKAAELAGRSGDALISTEPNEETVQQYRKAGGNGPRYGQVRVCWAETEEEAKQTVFRLWRHSGLGGTINQELPRPSDFDAVAESVTIDMAVEGVPCGPDPEPVIEAVRAWEQAGFDRIAIHQVGPDQAGFFRFWEQELRPELA